MHSKRAFSLVALFGRQRHQHRAFTQQPARHCLRTTDDGRQQRGKGSYHSSRQHLPSTVQNPHARTRSSTAGRKAERACCFQEANKGSNTRAASARVEHETRSPPASPRRPHTPAYSTAARVPPLTAFLGNHVRGSAATERTLCVSHRSAVYVSAVGFATIWSAEQCILLEFAADAAGHYECLDIPAVLPGDRSSSTSAADFTADTDPRIEDTLITRLW